MTITEGKKISAGVAFGPLPNPVIDYLRSFACSS
jgi:hypothetical protein